MEAKKIIRKLTLVLIIFTSTLSIDLRAQTKMYNVRVGDDISELHIKNIQDAPFTDLFLSDFPSDKLLILDFWATWCIPCVYNLPKLDSLQQQLTDRIQIITVTEQEESVVRSFFKERQERGEFSSPLPKIFADSSLKTLFPHNIIPHYVWIKEGKVVAITETVNKEQIKLALNNEQVTLDRKVDIRKAAYNRDSTPLLEFLMNTADRETVRRLDSYSLMTKFIPELGYNGGASSKWDSLGNRRITVTNMNIRNLYAMAYGRMRTFISHAAIDVCSQDSMVGIYNLSGIAAIPLIEKRTFCYEVVAHDSVVFDKMQEDLKYAVPQFSAKVVDAIDTCLVLEKINDDIEKFVSDADSDLSDYQISGDCILIKNTLMEGFRTSLEANVFRYSKFPVVDQTGFNKRFDITLCGKKNSIAAINIILRPYGLRIVKKPAWHKRLVISDNK